MKKIFLSSIIFTLTFTGTNLIAQVTTNFNNTQTILGRGKFDKEYKQAIDFEIPVKNINDLLEKERRELSASNEEKPFRLAEPTPVDIDVAKLMEWKTENSIAFGKYNIHTKGALSASINFDRFFLPKGTEMYVYNENGEMITGPVTENENNENRIWGSWVYKGGMLTIEIKIPASTHEQLILHANNIAYGYKEIYKSVKAGGFGQSGPCNINVICPLGNGWEAERNSVSTILSATGGEFCTGSLVTNTCGSNRPFYLTANHCFEANTNVAGWRFSFQEWSPVCPNPGTNVNGLMFNGSTLRARNAASDFCLLELNTTPQPNSGLHYSGWTRVTAPAQNATAIHHPSGDVMKISRGNNPVTIASAFGTINQHWQANWSPQDNGSGQIVTPVTEGGSSGSPLFDQNHRIIGQLHGGPSFCNGTQLWDFYGRFDLSWTGGGTTATRLSDWLDPSNSGTMTTNTTNVSNLLTQGSSLSLSITGSDYICSGSSIYTLNNAPPGIGIAWTLSNTTIASLAVNGNQATVTKTGDGNLTLTATVGAGCNYTNNVVSKNIKLGAYSSSDYTMYGGGSSQQPLYWCPNQTYSFSVNGPGSNYNWTIPTGWTPNYISNYLCVIKAPSSTSPPTGTVTVTFNEPCANNVITKSFFTAYSSSACIGTDPRFTYSPNPAPSYLYVSVAPGYVGTVTIKRIQIIRISTGITYFDQSYGSGVNNAYITTSSFPTGTYSLRIFDGSIWATYQFVR